MKGLAWRGTKDGTGAGHTDWMEAKRSGDLDLDLDLWIWVVACVDDQQRAACSVKGIFTQTAAAGGWGSARRRLTASQSVGQSALCFASGGRLASGVVGVDAMRVFG